MKLALDVDGVLARFNDPFAKMLAEVTGKKLCPDPFPTESPCWEWPRHYGYTFEEEAATWKVVNRHESWWQYLDEVQYASQTLHRLDRLAFDGHDIYFITNRKAHRGKQQTERWLEARGMYNPTVLVAREKHPVLNSLRIDVFIDDYLVNVNEAARNCPNTRVYVKDEQKNRMERHPSVLSVSSAWEMLDRESL